MSPLWASAVYATEMPSSGNLAFTTLSSGQQVYVVENHTQPIITIDTWVNTGSAQEDAANNGVSHFLEHLLFKGTEHYKVGEIDQILESRGAEFNAATSNDFTHYHITTAAPYFKEALNLHADMLLNATIETPELDRERKVVQEEINRALDSPGRKAYLTMEQLLFGSHPYAMDTLGPKKNIQTMSRDSILGYYHRWYQPENFKTVVSGDITSQEATELVSQAFESAYNDAIHPEPGAPAFKPITPPTQPTSRVLPDPNLSQAEMVLGFLAPAVEKRKDNLALDVAGMILGQGMSSRLVQTLKEDEQLVSDISAANITQQQAGIFIINAQCKPENRNKVKQRILEVLQTFKTTGPTPDELDKAKKQVIKDFAFLNESTEGVANTLGYNVTIGKLEDYTQYVANIQKLTAEAVTSTTNTYLNPGRAVLVESIPFSKGQKPDAEARKNVALLKQKGSETLSPCPVAASVFTQASQTANGQPAVTKMVLPRGLTLLLKPVPQTQTVALSILAKGGRLAEPQAGVSELMSRVQLKSTEHYTGQELSALIERLGLNLSADSQDDYNVVSASSLSSDLPQLLSVLDEVLVHPTFPASELEKEREQLLDSLKSQRDNPSSLMFENLTEALYPNHPYGAVGDRLEASLPTITRESVVALFTKQFSPENLVVAVVGNFDPAAIVSFFEQIYNNTETCPTDIPRADFTSASSLEKESAVVVEKPEQAASWIGYGWLAPAISRDKTYIALKVANTLLGSGLSSRLFVNLREKQGLAYHVASMFPSSIAQGRFMMYIGTDPKNRDQVKSGFETEIKRLMQEPISPEELARTKSKLIGQFALGHESNASQALYLSLYETLGVGYGFDATYPKLIESVTTEDIQAAAKAVFSQPRVVSEVLPKVIRTDGSTP